MLLVVSNQFVEPRSAFCINLKLGVGAGQEMTTVLVAVLCIVNSGSVVTEILSTRKPVTPEVPDGRLSRTRLKAQRT